MATGLDDAQRGRLERSCGPRDWIRAGRSRPGLERVEACFARHAFAPHRHDTYAIGITLQGVQAFDYRGAAQRSTFGQVFVLHPDELHDGRAGSEAGFRYRILYLDPGLVGEALGGVRALPFVRDVVSDDRKLGAVVAAALADLDQPLEDLRHDQIVADLARALAEHDRSVRRKPSSLDRRAALRARGYLDAEFSRPVRSSELEAVTGLGRYTLARHFRICFGTSPYRYLVMRRLDRARALIASGTPLCEAVLAVGFADQSHLTRHFRRTYGLARAAGRRWPARGRGPLSAEAPRRAATTALVAPAPVLL